MATKLQCYNAALSRLGPVRLTGLTENRPERIVFDQHYDEVIEEVLESGLWFFALRTQEWTPDVDAVDSINGQYVYNLPSDYVRLRKISPDQAQVSEDLSYRREGEVILSDHSVLYVTYVSNSASYGLNLAAWPQLFANTVADHLALRSNLPITKDRGTTNDLEQKAARSLAKARRVDAVDERIKLKQPGTWVLSRSQYNRGQRREST